MRLVRFVDRMAKPRSFPVGVELDGNVERIQFELPQFRADQQELIYWANADRADLDTLEGGVWTIDQNVTQITGELTCYITVSVNNKVVWHSADFIARVVNLADIEHRIRAAYPTAIQKAVDIATAAAQRLEDAVPTVMDEFVRGDMLQKGEVYRALKPGDFTIWKQGRIMAVETDDDPDGDPKKAIIKENPYWSIYSWRPPQRMMFRADLLEKNPSITGVLPMAFRLGDTYYAMDSDRRGDTFVADEILLNCFDYATEYYVPITRKHTPDEFADFYYGSRVVEADNPYGDEWQQQTGWDMLAITSDAERSITIESMDVNADVAHGGVLPMAYIHGGSSWPLRASDEGKSFEANVLIINRQTTGGGSTGDTETVAPIDFEKAYEGYVFWGGTQGVPTFEENENWDVYKLDLGEATQIRIDGIEVNYRTVYPAGYELDGQRFPLDLNEVGHIVTADALLINHQHSDDSFSADSITYTPGVQPVGYAYSINSVTYTADELVPTDEATRKQAAIRRVGLTFNVRRDFEDSILYTDVIGECDSIVVFGDSIFAGYMPWDSDLAPDYIGKGVTQQVAEMLGLPMTNYAVPGALLSENTSEFKTVVEQVRDWTKPAGTTPLILIDGGTNDSYEFQLSNLGEYGDEDTSTIYGAMQAIIDMLEDKGVDLRHIVITTPIPNGIRGDAEFVTSVDRRNTAIGAAMWQVGITNRCSVINGYHTIFGQLSDNVHKEILMPDDTHPSYQGAAYYADHIVRLLGGRGTKMQNWLAHTVAQPFVKGNESQNGRVFMTLSQQDFSLYALSKKLVANGDTVTETDDEDWEIWSYKYFFDQNFRLRVDSMTVNPAVTGVLPMAYRRVYHNVDLDQYESTDYPLTASMANGSMIETCELLVNRRRIDGQLAIMDMGITVQVRPDFDNMIMCGDHMDDLTDVVVFGDSIWANHLSNAQGVEIDGHLTNSGVMDQFAALMDLTQENHALGGSTISAMQATPKSVWQQVREWTQQAGTTPLIMINGGTNDQRLYQLCNMGSYDHIDPIEIYGGLDEILSYLISTKHIEPWQIVVTTPIPKGTRANAYYRAIYEAQLTAIGYAMYEICMKYGVSVINGFHGPFGGMESVSLKTAMLPDDCHPSAEGAKRLANYLHQEIIGGRTAHAELISGNDYRIIM